MKNRVILIKNNFLKKLREQIGVSIKNKFVEGDNVCIKVHMGEYGNLYHIRPQVIGLVVDELKKIGTKPFVFDSPVAYPGSRETVEKYNETARKHGFIEEVVGCPIIISNNGEKVKSKLYGEIKISKEVAQADGLVVVSHFKGHEMSNFGGAIKNIGMGCVTKESKNKMHTKSQVEIINLDECTGCGVCVGVCSENALSLDESVNKIKLDQDFCFGCGACENICPQKVLGKKTQPLSTGLAEVTSLILDKFDKNKMIFINSLLDITNRCDCYPIGDSDTGEIVAPNIGFLLSDNIVSIDKASLDLVDKSTGGKFGKIWSTNKDWQIEGAETYGLGNSEYDLVEV